MPIIEPKIAKPLEAKLISELTKAFTAPGAPPDITDSHKKMAGAIAKAVASVLASTLLQDAQVAPGIPTLGSPTAQATSAAGKLI
jgi:hypothetical protein